MWAATAAFAMLLAAYSVAVPLNEAPDEPQHLDLVLGLAARSHYPAFDGRRMSAAANRLCPLTAASVRACPRPGERATGRLIRQWSETAPSRDRRPTFAELGGNRGIGGINQMPQHPPLYYQAMAVALRVERFVVPGDWPLDREVALLRLCNAALIAPLPLLSWWAARRLGLGQAPATIAALVPLAIPQLLHIGSTINNDNLLTLCGAVLIGLLAGVVRGDRSLTTAVAIGVTTGLALLSKALAVAFPPVIVVAYVVGFVRSPRAIETAAGTTVPTSRWGTPAARRAAARAAGTAGVITLALGGWWYVGNRIRTGKFSPSIESTWLARSSRPAGFHPHLGEYISSFASLITERFWGWFGWFSVRLTLGVIVVATVLLAVAVVTALGSGLNRSARAGPASDPSPADGPLAPPRRIDLAVLLLPAVVLVAVVASHAWSLYVRAGTKPFIQGRYLFSAIVGIAVVVAVGVCRLAGRWAPVVMLAWVGLMQGDAAHRIISGYWGAPGRGLRGELRAMVAWSPWPGPLSAIGAILALMALAWLTIETVRAVSPRDPGDAVPADSSVAVPA